VMVKRLHNPWWFLPGGKQEPQESPRIAALREAYEETGLDVTPYMVNAEIVLKKCLRPTRVWVATNVPGFFFAFGRGPVVFLSAPIIRHHGDRQQAEEAPVGRRAG